ncbi:hypothetical protein LLEC1_05226 [Akanthomyces lecanii]|uniref:Uncharacterized protein n=1 Tax=Cordyceps confragosa TaxID=2714763 RepID=A0A179IKV9_CORDF|nr:hypothetical protein LLEC1_05226 [Akanthomyces lecanii]
MLCVIPIAIIGYAVIANAKLPEACFSRTCLMVLGMYCAVPPVLVWNANNSAGHYKRATTKGLQLAIANAGGFVAMWALLFVNLLTLRGVLANILWCAKVNRDKARGVYSEYIGSGDDRDPEFKMVL